MQMKPAQRRGVLKIVKNMIYFSLLAKIHIFLLYFCSYDIEAFLLQHMGKYYFSILTTSCLSISLLAGSLMASGSPLRQDTTRTTPQQPAKTEQVSLHGNNTEKSGSLTTSFIRFFNPSFRSNRTPITENDKLISRVKVFPNPVSDQINLSFKLSKDNTVSIKLMDALGNEVMTLLSQRLDAGEQTHSFSIENKLSSGYYFIRLVAGSETVIKRVSVL